MNERRTFSSTNLSDTASQVTKMVQADLGDGEKIKRAKSDTSFNLTFGLDKWAKGNSSFTYLVQTKSLLKMP